MSTTQKRWQELRLVSNRRSSKTTSLKHSFSGITKSPPEKMHLTFALGFELDHCDDPIVYNRMTERLCDIDLELA